MCAYCEKRLNGSFAEQVRRDTYSTGGFLIVLAALGVLPAFSLLVALVRSALGGQREDALGLTIALLLLLGPGGLTAYFLGRSGGRVLVGSLAGAGIFVLLAFSLVVFAGVVCLGRCGAPMH